MKSSHNTYRKSYSRSVDLSRPERRELRVFAFDPSLSQQVETENVNELVLSIPWEESPGSADHGLPHGPAGEYLEVIDVDPASDRCYSPVDLDDPYILATRGLAPSVGNPQFHQQMTYAVAMRTIDHFEQALGRRMLWSGHWDGSKEHFVRRLRVYPHALREANAYYHPSKKALLFGYFRAPLGEMTFTCLSYDIVAHEVTHALLDGMHRRFVEASNPDLLALHEAFADIVALFQRFQHPEVLKHQIEKTKGDLSKQNMLGQLAQQFGKALGHRGALRSAIGEWDGDQWMPYVPDGTEYHSKREPHALGEVLVAAVFDAFLTIYKKRVRDLLRIASGGTGILKGDLHPDLVNRMASEASEAAARVLQMCIRAMDYVPPVDVTFGDYLRALVTADADITRGDDRSYQLAFIEAFARRGIQPEDVRTMSLESLLWKPPAGELGEFEQLASESLQQRDVWDVAGNREEIWNSMGQQREALHQWLSSRRKPEILKSLGIRVDDDAPAGTARDENGIPKFEVHSIRPARRVSAYGQQRTDFVIEITQKCGAMMNPDDQQAADKKFKQNNKKWPYDFTFRGGCTLIINIDTMEPRYCIFKRIDSERRLQRMRKYLRESGASLQSTYFTATRGDSFAALHRGV